MRLESGDIVTILADGTIGMTPWGNGVVSTPEGGANFGWFVPNTIPGGALVGKVGNHGEFFKVGSRHSFTVERPGVLQLALGMQADYVDNQFPGKYNVRVRVQRK